MLTALLFAVAASGLSGFVILGSQTTNNKVRTLLDAVVPLGFSISTVISERVRLLGEEFHRGQIAGKATVIESFSQELRARRRELSAEQSHKITLASQIKSLKKQLRDAGLEPAISAECAPLLVLDHTPGTAAGTGLAVASPTESGAGTREGDTGSSLIAIGLYPS